jgi:hypothetical protein
MSSDRITKHEDGQWYFRVRGNQLIGPFENSEEAEKAFARYRRIWSGRADFHWPKTRPIKRDNAK